jgi:hypothetical protein
MLLHGGFGCDEFTSGGTVATVAGRSSIVLRLARYDLGKFLEPMER